MDGAENNSIQENQNAARETILYLFNKRYLFLIRGIQITWRSIYQNNKADWCDVPPR